MLNKEPRVLQLIDSFAAGGAERVSVNIANALADAGISSYICATRKGGSLEQFIAPNVNKLILNKKFTFDLSALWRLARFIKSNNINLIHAHSSSFFLAVLCKPFTGVRIVWHDHNGLRYEKPKNKNMVLKQLSHFFDFAVAVNEKLVAWSQGNLYISSDRIIYLPNFARLSVRKNEPKLPGCKGKRIVCLANLRWQKDHMTLLLAFAKIHEKHGDWYLLLVGQDYQDKYSNQLKTYINLNGLGDSVHILGARDDTANILKASTIGVISSETEGLPVALLEYGLAKLAVVSTDVGQCADVLGFGTYGLVVEVKDSDSLSGALLRFIDDESIRNKMARELQSRIHKDYSAQAVVEQLTEIYSQVLHD